MSKKPRRPGIALLGIAGNYIDAMMWKDMLEQKGIPCMVRDGSATIGDLQAALPGPGHMEVYVPATALERSRKILGPSLTQALAREPTPAATTLSLMWIAWIVGPVVVAGTAGFILIALEII